jgi:hypothetical protein
MIVWRALEHERKTMDAIYLASPNRGVIEESSVPNGDVYNEGVIYVRRLIDVPWIRHLDRYIGYRDHVAKAVVFWTGGPDRETLQLVKELAAVEEVTFRPQIITAEIIEELAKVRTLNSLKFEESTFTQDAWRALPSIASLRRLSFSHCNLDGCDLTLLQKCNELRRVDWYMPKDRLRELDGHTRLLAKFL